MTVRAVRRHIVVELNGVKTAELQDDPGRLKGYLGLQLHRGQILDVVRHPNRDRYPNQTIIVLGIEDCVWLVPYVKSKGVRFLKTIIPGRKATGEYLS